MARSNKARFPNESPDYRRARQNLLVEEIELRRHIERVAELRRALPPGGEVTRNYLFEGEHGKASFADLFGDKQTLAIYSYMFGPQRQAPCPMCTSFMGTWEHKLPDIERRIAFVFISRSPIARLTKKARGWTRHRIFSDGSGDYTRDYVSAEDADVPGSACSRGATARAVILVRRDERRDGRSRTGSARCAGFRSAVDYPRYRAGGTRQQLVSEARPIECSKAGQSRKTTRAFLQEHIANLPCLTKACV